MKICVKSRDGQDGKRAVPRAGGQLMGSDRGGREQDFARAHEERCPQT
ncbi:hypothetical protein Cadr_000012496 [Camelus dromedarius]|uniref:Uncharacterized protein n=1 Tax=Camelus dromedarius TaxID=9838 RepID=A0A5N4D994_CAMDR|nr:hypothetical protein Cadr_000012496 [Camelus dromedarius]